LRILVIAMVATLIFCVGCNKSEKEVTDKETTNGITEAEKTTVVTKPTKDLTVSEESEETDHEKIAIQTVIKNMYRWQESCRPAMQMKAIVKDGLIISFDMTKTKAHIKEIEKTGFFAQEFLDNMLKIYTTENRMLKNKEVEWLNGDMSPFGSDSSPWCNCQDVPTNNDPFGIIKFKYLEFNDQEAILNWYWDISGGWNRNYKIRTAKEDGKWKIAWMEGWDHDTFTKIY